MTTIRTPVLPLVKPGSDVSARLMKKILSKTAKVGIIGLGYVGLPLARALSHEGFSVLGFDIAPAKVETLQRGESYIGHIPSNDIRHMRERRFDATSDF